MKSDEWRDRRDRILMRDGYRCRQCGTGKNLRVHHIRYPAVYGTESDDDLVTMCDDCHRKIHEYDIVKKQEKQSARDRKKIATLEWIAEAKEEDFLYGGRENMCRLQLLKSSKEEYIRNHQCELFGVSYLQFPLGYGHRLLVREMYGRGYSLYEIGMILPLERTRIKEYVEHSNFGSEERWDAWIPLEELKAKVEELIADDQSRRKVVTHEH